MNKRAAIIHGTMGSPTGNWFPWLAARLEKRGYQVAIPTFPTPDGQSLSSWFATWDEQIGAEPVEIAVGHSLGGTFLLRLLERGAPIRRVVLVSSFDCLLALEEFDRLNRTFVEAPLDVEAIKGARAQIEIIHGDNDPYVPLSIAQRISTLLDARLTIVSGGKHLNAESGFQELPLLEPLLADR